MFSLPKFTIAYENFILFHVNNSIPTISKVKSTKQKTKEAAHIRYNVFHTMCLESTVVYKTKEAVNVLYVGRLTKTTFE